jgi:hypothetical protein
MNQGDIVKAHCNLCAGERNHLIVHLHKTGWSEEIADDARIYGEDRYELLQCAGCESVTLRHTSFHSEIRDDDGEVAPTITYYPPPTFRRPPKWLHGAVISDGDSISIVWLPGFVTRLMREVYTALHGECLSLAAMGVRALLETIMIERVGDRGSFGKNLGAFQADGHISPIQRTVLETTLELGHASIHRGYVPSRGDITLVLDITENLVEMLYVSNKQADVLRKKIPARAKPKSP